MHVNKSDDFVFPLEGVFASQDVLNLEDYSLTIADLPTFLGVYFTTILHIYTCCFINLNLVIENQDVVSVASFLLVLNAGYWLIPGRKVTAIFTRIYILTFNKIFKKSFKETLLARCKPLCHEYTGQIWRKVNIKKVSFTTV